MRMASTHEAPARPPSTAHHRGDVRMRGRGERPSPPLRISAPAGLSPHETGLLLPSARRRPTTTPAPGSSRPGGAAEANGRLISRRQIAVRGRAAWTVETSDLSHRGVHSIQLLTAHIVPQHRMGTQRASGGGTAPRTRHGQVFMDMTRFSLGSMNVVGRAQQGHVRHFRRRAYCMTSAGDLPKLPIYRIWGAGPHTCVRSI